MATIREQFEQAKADFAAAFKAGDAARAKEAGELAEKYEHIVKMADEKGALLHGDGAGERGHVAAKGFGEWAVKSMDLGAFSGKGQASVATADGYKAATDAHAKPAGAAGFDTFYDTSLVTGARRRLQVRDLFGAESRDATSIQYLVEGALEGDTGISAEGEAGHQFHFGDKTPKNVALKKVFGIFKESWEITQDEAWLATAIQNRGVYTHDLKVEDTLVSDLGGTSGILAAPAKAATLADDIFGAISSIGQASPFMADAVVLNPADYKALRLQKDTNGQYMGGGFFTPAYAQSGAVQLYPDVWGMTTVVTPAVAAGTAYVGAFKQGGSVFTKAGDGLRVEVSNSDKDDFEHDLVAVRVIERLALALRYPAAFDKLTIAAA